ncbi:TMA7-domain-containing protein, partial [Wolfiporia cocos MD-104 SS10]
MSGRQGGKVKPLKAPKKDKKELDEDDVAFKERKRLEEAALKAARDKAAKGKTCSSNNLLLTEDPVLAQVERQAAESRSPARSRQVQQSSYYTRTRAASATLLCEDDSLHVPLILPQLRGIACDTKETSSSCRNLLHLSDSLHFSIATAKGKALCTYPFRGILLATKPLTN